MLLYYRSFVRLVVSSFVKPHGVSLFIRIHKAKIARPRRRLRFNALSFQNITDGACVVVIPQPLGVPVRDGVDNIDR